MAGRKRLGPTPNSPKNKKNGSRSSSTNRALAALMLVAFIFSAATMFIISPTVARSIASLDNMGMVSEKDMNSNQLRSTSTSTSPPTFPPGAPRSTIADLITWMLSERDKDAHTQHSALSRLEDSPPTPLEFLPGSLSLSHAQTLQHCFADPRIYGKHVQGNREDGSNVPVSYSEKHKLAYVMLPKSGSSTARYMLKNEFHARETKKSLQPKEFKRGGKMEGVEVISFVRDPLSRFFSQYDEAYVRTTPWQNPGSNTPHPFPYLYENIHTYHDYEDIFCPVSTRKSRKDCIYRPSKENGTLASRFERFVQEYDGRDPFDIHLTLQVPMMSSINGMPLHMTQIYNTTDSEGGWKRIANQFLGENALEGRGVIAGRSFPRRFKSDLVSVETQRRICELTLLDYCCLNLPLPTVCLGQHYFPWGNDAVRRELFCVLDAKGHIQPGIFPGIRKS
eukprot:CAMPEP_0201878480 /NCGR_PEP_ID=MMETSP0902-20130614/9631_1 /ASSEMBLY_ACC=CAM_ASM_000551 /TAXON_ID=420261 /ORGANISM="Thalassiosira antarctica, Strain CCMP982" /LENGTH=449 /DNA_ID=CAMNT_0048406137 /DNA_START=53 /DNA_END=1402 /DNA_ORIENTATION=+